MGTTVSAFPLLDLLSPICSFSVTGHQPGTALNPRWMSMALMPTLLLLGDVQLTRLDGRKMPWAVLVVKSAAFNPNLHFFLQCWWMYLFTKHTFYSNRNWEIMLNLKELPAIASTSAIIALTHFSGIQDVLFLMCTCILLSNLLTTFCYTFFPHNSSEECHPNFAILYLICHALFFSEPDLYAVCQ